tara:strand:+ start:1472 stop:2164 length:693 start_codon:yes stop_codon:yes gene_type:complete
MPIQQMMLGAAGVPPDYSVQFDSAGEHLISSSSDYAFGTGDFTAECWIYPTVINSYHNIFGTRGSYYNSTSGWSLGFASNGMMYWYTNGFTILSTNTVSTNTWYHVVAERSGNWGYVFVNGAVWGTANTSSYNLTNSAFRIGDEHSSGSQRFIGLISNVRVTKGEAVYDNGYGFTSPTAALTTTSQSATASNVKLLCCNGSTVESFTKASATLTAGDSNNPPTLSTTYPF